MSLVAGRTVTPAADDVPDTDDGGETITAGHFWPAIALKDVRLEMRITGAVTTTRLKQAAIEATGHVIDQLTGWQEKQLKAGFASLETVPARQINDESVKIHRYRRAVFSITRALLIENYRDVDTTGDAGEKRAAGLTLQAADLWRDARWAIADIRDEVRNFCGGILVKVQAMQGDTLDLLCQRHYGTTQGVTEIVLAANPGIAEQIFLTAGQVVELPEIERSTQQETVQLWT